MTGRDIGHIAEIMRNDFKSAFSNPIVTFMLIALIILPSLYALINIQACWDPYSNTGDVPFAIANLDNGSTFEGNQLNIGNELVKDLKNNDKFDWTFVTEDELRDGVYKGDYYAGIVIPKNLTENVLSITSDDPQQAKLEYVVNMKANPVAAKLTDSASNSVYLTLNSKIIQIINLAAYGKLGELQEGLASGAGQLASGGNQLAAGADQVAAGADQVKGGVSQVEEGADQVKDGASQVEQGADQVEQGADKVQSGVPAVNKGADDVKKGSSAVQEGASQVEKGSEEIQSAIDPSVIPEGPIKEYVDGNVKLADGSGQVAEGASKLADGSVALAEGSSKLANGSGEVAGGASRLAGGAVDLAGGSTDLADGSVQLAEGSLSLAAGSQLLSNGATQALFAASSALASSADSLAGITGINETLLGDYFFSPIKLDRNEIFPIDDYGSQIAPFYLVLSMWVGALITNTMLKPGISEGTKYSPIEMYFGKLAMFLFMAFFQSLVTIVGSMILGIYIDNLPLFIVSVILVSGVFMAFIYSLNSALGDVGKGIAIVLLLFQISGTGGIYPIQIMDPIFQALYPYLPMTYGITLVREAQLGVIWSNYLPALVMIIAIGVITEVVSLIIKEKADKPLHFLEEVLHDSGLF